MIRVLVAEDLPTARRLVVAILQSDPEIDLVGEAVDGQEAVEKTRALKPDLVTMDVLMPRMDGFEATRQIMASQPTPIVIVSSLEVSEVAFAMQALRAGALAALPKPRGPGSPGFEDDARRLITTAKVMSQVRLLRRAEAAEPRRARPAARGAPGQAVRAVAMAASAGGPAALQRVLSELPADFPLPVLVVQHIALGFAEGFARWLDGSVPPRVKVAEAGEGLAAGTVYVAPDDWHLGLTPGGKAIALSQDPPMEGFRPSASFLFRSAAAALGGQVAAVVLSGMGRDGIEGLRAVRAAGGRILAQDRESSLVYGMPGAAAEAGLTDEILPLADISARLKGFS